MPYRKMIPISQSAPNSTFKNSNLCTFNTEIDTERQKTKRGNKDFYTINH